MSLSIKGRGNRKAVKQARNLRKKVSFERRYHMTRSEWASLKKDLRKAGRDIEINQLYRKARRA